MYYLDSSFIFAIIFDEPWSEAVEAYLHHLAPKQLCTSEWTNVEFGGALSGRIRRGEMPLQNKNTSLAFLDKLLSESFVQLPITSSEYMLAQSLLLRDDIIAIGLRPGDALHLAVAMNHSVETFFALDRKMLQIGQAIGLSVSDGGFLS
jgi:uncharacterized protein